MISGRRRSRRAVRRVTPPRRASRQPTAVMATARPATVRLRTSPPRHPHAGRATGRSRPARHRGTKTAAGATSLTAVGRCRRRHAPPVMRTRTLGRTLISPGAARRVTARTALAASRRRRLASLVTRASRSLPCTRIRATRPARRAMRRTRRRARIARRARVLVTRTGAITSCKRRPARDAMFFARRAVSEFSPVDSVGAPGVSPRLRMTLGAALGLGAQPHPLGKGASLAAPDRPTYTNCSAS
jgi:hypothetical protein